MKLRPLLSLLALLALLLPDTATARPIVADLSLRSIPIDSGFKGLDILLFGARNDAGDIVVVIRGPEITYLVRKKERVAGIWINRQQITFNGIYGYYSVASNRDLKDLHNNYLLAKLNIGLEHEAMHGDIPPSPLAREFEHALMQDKINHALYSPEIGDVSFIGDTLFRTIIHFPENIPRGTYTAEVYLFSDGLLTGFQSTPLKVYKTGFDAFVYDFAHDYKALYGILAVSLALFAGWLAGIIFKRV